MFISRQPLSELIPMQIAVNDKTASLENLILGMILNQ